MKAKYLYSRVVWAVITVILSATISCNKFLDVKPSKGTSVTIKTTADLDALLNSYTTFYLENDNVVIYGTDDNGFSTTLYNAQPYLFPAATIQFSLWDTQNLPNTDQSNFSGPNFWSSEYAKIFNANVVLFNLDQVTGTAAEKAALKADAQFIRAYSYWELANTYCLPYTNANQNEPGLPIKTTPDYELVTRATLAATYQQIEADLTAALATSVPLVQGGVARNWRANTAAVNGFAARYYLNRNDYAKALNYANASLALYSTLVDYNTDMRYGTPTSININGGTANQQTVTLNFPYTHDGSSDYNVNFTNYLSWKEIMYFRLLNNTSAWYIPSQDLLNLYDKANDLRYKYHFVQNLSYKRGLTSPPVSYPGYVFFYEDKLPEGPTVAEMYLIKAECQARIGDINSAMTTVNLLHSKRVVAGSAQLLATTQDQSIATILQERRREMPFTERWFDIRRFNNNDYPKDDVPVLSRSFYPYTANNVSKASPVQTYTLPANSRRFASPLPQADVNTSNGLILQNTY